MSSDSTPQQRFRELHREGTFLMVNVADQATAKAVATTGVAALATSSAAHAETVRIVADGAGGPINVLALVGAEHPTLDELTEAGVRRVSLGSSLFHAQVSHAAALATRIQETGCFDP